MLRITSTNDLFQALSSANISWSPGSIWQLQNNSEEGQFYIYCSELCSCPTTDELHPLSKQLPPVPGRWHIALPLAVCSSALPKIQGRKGYDVPTSPGWPLDFAHFQYLLLLILIKEWTQWCVCTQSHACCLVSKGCFEHLWRFLIFSMCGLTHHEHKSILNLLDSQKYNDVRPKSSSDFVPGLRGI